jgi:nucleoside-triphosphatase THEP1
MTYTIEDARREQIKLRMAILGVTGAGKTRGALEVATNLFSGDLKVGVIDTEHGRSRLYADRYRFRRLDLLTDQSPEAWIRAMDDLDRDGCDVQILDSVTHEWNGKNGVLAQADKFGEWKTVRPKHNSFVERILSSQAHVIVCIRAKMKYAVSEEEDTRPNRSGTRQVIEKVGLGPVQDEQLLYEFDVVADVDVKTHEATFSNRCDPLVGQTKSLVPGTDVAEILSGVLTPEYVSKNIATLEKAATKRKEPEAVTAND